MMMAREHPRTDQPEHWQSLGACKTRPDLNWFPERGQNIGEQRQVCAGCPVRTDCLAEALDLGAHADFGIWGGTSERQRRTMRRNRKRSVVVDPPARKTRSDAGIAQPSKGPRVTDRVWVCLDGDPPCVPSGRCTDGCRWTVPSPVPQENNQ